MSTCQILFTPDSTNLPSLVLSCQYTFTPGEPMVMYDRDGAGYPGSPDSVEVYDVKCVDIDRPGPIPECDLQEIIGGLCWLADPKQIEQSVMKEHCEAMAESRLGPED